MWWGGWGGWGGDTSVTQVKNHKNRKNSERLSKHLYPPSFFFDIGFKSGVDYIQVLIYTESFAYLNEKQSI